MRRWIVVRHRTGHTPRPFPHRYWTRIGAERGAIRLTRAVTEGYFSVARWPEGTVESVRFDSLVSEQTLPGDAE